MGAPPTATRLLSSGISGLPVVVLGAALAGPLAHRVEPGRLAAPAPGEDCTLVEHLSWSSPDGSPLDPPPSPGR